MQSAVLQPAMAALRAMPEIDHDRVAVTSTFWHEMGHHLMDRLGEKAKSIQVMFRSDFGARMSTASELIAETMVALACYPRTAAVGLFQRDLKLDRSPDAYATPPSSST